MSAARLRTATAADAAAIAAIYAPYVAESVITFELDPPDAAEMAQRMATVQAHYPWLVAEDADGAMLGYAYAARFHPRAAYRWAAEATVYLAQDARGRGIGRILYEELLARLERQGIVSVIGLITLPNAASVGLHEALRFVRAGCYAKVGYKLGQWHDVGLWQRDLRPRTDDPAEPDEPDRS